MSAPTAIVTGDRRHLRPLDAYAGIAIRTPMEFRASLSADATVTATWKVNRFRVGKL